MSKATRFSLSVVLVCALTTPLFAAPRDREPDFSRIIKKIVRALKMIVTPLDEAITIPRP
jgi:hypothetical protein